MTAFTWPESIFELDSGLGLAVCTAHRGLHCFHLGGCIAFASQRQPKRLRVRIANQDAPPPEAPPLTVELDESRLAAGIAMALDQLMARRREERTSTPSAPGVPAGNGQADILDRYRE